MFNDCACNTSHVGTLGLLRQLVQCWGAFLFAFALSSMQPHTTSRCQHATCCVELQLGEKCVCGLTFACFAPHSFHVPIACYAETMSDVVQDL